MGIKRYIASKDNTITNAFKENLITRGTGSNMGASDVLETFSIYGQNFTSASSTGVTRSQELSRILIQFPTTDITTDRTNGDIPASGSVDFYLRMFNAKHASTVPRDLKLVVVPISSSWQEGFGLDMENYQDITKDSEGSNWMNATGDYAQATLVDAIDTTGVAISDEFTMTVPAAAGGDATAHAFKFVDTAVAGVGSDNFGIALDTANTPAKAAAAVVDAINGDSHAAVGYNGGSNGTVLTAGTIGLTAALSSPGSTKITLTMDDSGAAGNVPVLVANNGFDPGSDLLVNTAFTGGSGPWATVGGTYLTASTNNDFGDRTQAVTFTKGTEDLELNITDTVERWIKGFGSDGFENYGLGIHVTGSQEAYFSSSLGTFASSSAIQNVLGAQRSYYTKKFFSRTSEFFFKRPLIEARWDSTTRDNRGNFYYSSSLLSGDDNLGTLYLYNYVNGRLKNIPGVTDPTENVYMQTFSGSANNTVPSGSVIHFVTTTDYVAAAVPTVVTGGYVSTGIYSASFALTAAATPIKTLYDVWYLDGSNKLGAQISTGSFKPTVFGALQHNSNDQYVTNIINLKSYYDVDEKARIRVYTRLKNWSPTIYSKATAEAENLILENMYYKIIRTFDDYEVISYGTGSAATPQAIGSATSYTRLSTDISGSYFDLDMSLFEAGYMYGIRLAYFQDPGYREFNKTFKFRVEKTEDN